MLRITPFLWFDAEAEDAMRFYTSIFPRSKQIAVHAAGGKTMSVEFELEGQRVMALNGGPMYRFTEAVSFFVQCDAQQQVDELWDKLTADGGAPGRCGWLKDKFGFSWQIIPKRFGELLSTGDPAASQRVMGAMLTMDKLDVAQLEAAFAGT